MKGLPESFKSFIIHVINNKDKLTFLEFKTKLKFCRPQKIK